MSNFEGSRKPFIKGIRVPDLPPPLQTLKRADLTLVPFSDYYVLPSLRQNAREFISGQLGESVKFGVSKPPLQIDADAAVALFPLAKVFKMPPHKLAEDLAQAYNSRPVEELLVEAFGVNGFLNFRADRTRFSEKVISQVEELGEDYGKNKDMEGKSAVFDLSSPNIAKFMSVGHLRSTVIGESLSRIYEANGYDVIRDNHLGDWGTQFGMLGRAFELWGNEIPEIRDNTDPVTGLYKLYVKMHEEIEEEKKASTGDSSLETEGRVWFKRLEGGDAEAKKLLDWATIQSLHEFQRVYDMLGSKFDFMLGESFYVSMLPDVLQKLQEKNIASKDKTGAISANLEDKKMGRLVVQKSDGTSLYSTRDLATLVARTEWFNPDKIIYVVGGDQKDYFRQVFETFHRLSEGAGPELEHVSFGMVSLPEGKMSTRKGRVIFLEDVLNEAVSRVYERTKTSKQELSEEERRDVAQKVGVGAVIGLDLIGSRERNIKFDWEQALSFEGQGIPYVQYAYARSKGLVDKAENLGIEIKRDSNIDLTAPEEFSLVQKLAEYPDAVSDALAANQPSIVAGAVYEIAQNFNHLYNNQPILSENNDSRNTRLRLTRASGQVIKNGLDLLSIQPPARI